MNSTTSTKRKLVLVRKREAPTGEEVERERTMWGPNPDKALGVIESDFYSGGFTFISTLYAAAFGVQVPREIRKALGPRRPAIAIPEADWGALTQSYQRAANPLDLRDEWARLIDRLATKIFPNRTQEDLANGMAIRAHWLGKVRAKTEELAGQPIPSSWQEAEGRMTPFEREAMAWTKTRALEGCKTLERDAKEGLTNILIHARQAGEGAQVVQRRAFDGFADLNRDWRRLALTETAAAHFNGTLAAVPEGEEMEAVWVTAVGSCPWCQQWKGKVFRIVRPGDPTRNGATDLWAGKTNIGRHGASKARDGRVRMPAELWWACQPCHPNCSCSLVLRKARGK